MVISPLLGALPGVRHQFVPDPSLVVPAPWRPQQVHGRRIVRAQLERSDRPEADGVVTERPELPIGVITADCIPLLWAHPERPEVAAVHAGWRGLAAGILEATIAELGGPAGFRVALGPAADGCCYEVGEEVLDALAPPAATLFPSHHPQRRKIALRQIAASRLQALGLPPDRIQIVGPCTICSPEWPSYRRAGQQAGRSLAWIARSAP